MRKLLAIALLSAGSHLAYAQTPLTKGRGLLTGSIGYNRQSYTYDVTRSEFDFSVAAGRFVADNLVLGLDFSMQLNHYQTPVYSPIYGNPYTQDSNDHSYAVGPFARYYRFVGGDKFALFGQGGVGYGRTGGTSTTDANQGYVNVVPGIAFFPIPRFGLEASLRGISYLTDFHDASVLNAGFGLSNLQFGAAYYFGK